MPTANQSFELMVLKAFMEERKVPSERAMKTESEYGVKSDTANIVLPPITRILRPPLKQMLGVFVHVCSHFF